MRISRTKAEVGMQVAADITDTSGRLLVATGAMLTEQYLEALRRWNVPSLQIVPPEEKDPSRAGPLAPLNQEEEARVRDLFRHNDADHPAMQILLEQSLARARRRCGRRSPP